MQANALFWLVRCVYCIACALLYYFCLLQRWDVNALLYCFHGLRSTLSSLYNIVFVYVFANNLMKYCVLVFVCNAYKLMQYWIVHMCFATLANYCVILLCFWISYNAYTLMHFLLFQCICCNVYNVCIMVLFLIVLATLAS